MENTVKKYMNGKVIDLFNTKDGVSFKVELYDLSDNQRMMIENHQKAIARLRFGNDYQAKKDGVAFEDYVENYLAEHRTADGIWVGTSDINVFGLYTMKRDEDSKYSKVVSVPYDELPNPEGYTSEQIAEAKAKKIDELNQKKLAANGFTGIINPANF